MKFQNVGTSRALVRIFANFFFESYIKELVFVNFYKSLFLMDLRIRIIKFNTWPSNS